MRWNMLGKFNSFIEKWMAFVTPVCLREFDS